MAYSPPFPTIQRWVREARESVARYRVFEVVRLRLLAPPTLAKPAPVPAEFHVLSSVSFCNVIALTDDDQVVMVWQYRFGTDRLSLELPGGMIDAGEDAAEAARRELAEETGYEVESLTPFLVLDANPAIFDNACHTFVGRGARKVRAQKLDDAEDCEVALVPAAKIPELLDGGHVTHALIYASLEAFARRELGKR